MAIFDLHAACNPVLLVPGSELSPTPLNPTNYNLLAAGGASVLTGASGHAMLQIPQFQYSYSFSGTKHKYQVSLLPFAGSQIFPAFIKSGVIVPYRYIGIYPASWYDVSAAAYVDGDGVLSGWDNAADKIGSIVGKKPASNLTRAKFRGAAARVGAGWSIMDFWLYALAKMLYITKYGDFDSQTVLGQGNSMFSAWSFATDISATGKVLTINAIGRSTSGGNSGDYVNLMGIEDIFGGLFEFIDGWNINSGANYICSTPANFADDTTVNYSAYGSGTPTANGWQATLQQNVAMLPATFGGTGNSSVDICDYFWYSPGYVAPAVGGSAGSGSGAGLFGLGTYNASLYAGGDFGARLCF